MNRVYAWLPVGLLVLLVVILGIAMFQSGRTSQNLPLVDDPLPTLPLEAFTGGQPSFDPETIEGPYLINVWASWCGPCRIEHPFLMELNESGVPIYGIVYKDRPEDAAAFLNELGNPFSALANDPEGRVGLELGITGAPETFVVDSDGIIRARWRGAISQPVWNQTLGPALQAAQR